ncbi:Uncharacterised protein [Candidatus Gugararchaeum adminiculabundum]|nr:Uncharacterised protein [Candidatus Gugararchaeum adminiculabundum]
MASSEATKAKKAQPEQQDPFVILAPQMDLPRRETIVPSKVDTPPEKLSALHSRKILPTSTALTVVDDKGNISKVNVPSSSTFALPKENLNQLAEKAKKRKKFDIESYRPDLEKAWSGLQLALRQYANERNGALKQEKQREEENARALEAASSLKAGEQAKKFVHFLSSALASLDIDARVNHKKFLDAQKIRLDKIKDKREREDAAKTLKLRQEQDAQAAALAAKQAEEKRAEAERIFIFSVQNFAASWKLAGETAGKKSETISGHNKKARTDKMRAAAKAQLARDLILMHDSLNLWLQKSVVEAAFKKQFEANLLNFMLTAKIESDVKSGSNTVIFWEALAKSPAVQAAQAKHVAGIQALKDHRAAEAKATEEAKKEAAFRQKGIQFGNYLGSVLTKVESTTRANSIRIAKDNAKIRAANEERKKLAAEQKKIGEQKLAEQKAAEEEKKRLAEQEKKAAVFIADVARVTDKQMADLKARLEDRKKRADVAKNEAFKAEIKRAASAWSEAAEAQRQKSTAIRESNKGARQARLAARNLAKAWESAWEKAAEKSIEISGRNAKAKERTAKARLVREKAEADAAALLKQKGIDFGNNMRSKLSTVESSVRSIHSAHITQEKNNAKLRADKEAKEKLAAEQKKIEEQKLAGQKAKEAAEAKAAKEAEAKMITKLGKTAASGLDAFNKSVDANRKDISDRKIAREKAAEIKRQEAEARATEEAERARQEEIQAAEARKISEQSSEPVNFFELYKNAHYLNEKISIARDQYGQSGDDSIFRAIYKDLLDNQKKIFDEVGRKVNSGEIPSKINPNKPLERSFDIPAGETARMQSMARALLLVLEEYENTTGKKLKSSYY